MKGRALIKKQIVDSWSACVREDYLSQRINSERSLQASFWSQLNHRLGRNRRLFIEPRISAYDAGSKRAVYPDIVVCNSRQVIAVVELKYLPRAKPSYEKDIRTLDFIARKRKGITLANSRYSGPEVDAKEYGLSKLILFVWAGVHSGGTWQEERLFSDGYPSLRGSYLQLHCATKVSGEPEVYYYE